MSVSVQSPLSPLPSQVFSISTLDTLSPPPTPIAKRGASHHFFPSRASTPTPVFFPKSKSLLGHDSSGNVSAGGLTPASAPAVAEGQGDENTVENKQRLLAKKLASRGPGPSFRLAPRPRFGSSSSANRTIRNANDTDEYIKKMLGQMPPPPLTTSFPDLKSMEASIPQVPSLSAHSSSSSASFNFGGSNNSDDSNKEKSSTPPSTMKMSPRPIVLPMKQSATLSQHQALHKLPSFQRNGMAKRSVPMRKNSFVARSA